MFKHMAHVHTCVPVRLKLVRENITLISFQPSLITHINCIMGEFDARSIKAKLFCLNQEITCCTSNIQNNFRTR